MLYSLLMGIVEVAKKIIFLASNHTVAFECVRVLKTNGLSIQ